MFDFLDAGPKKWSWGKGCGVWGANLVCVYHHIPHYHQFFIWLKIIWMWKLTMVQYCILRLSQRPILASKNGSTILNLTNGNFWSLKLVHTSRIIVHTYTQAHTDYFITTNNKIIQICPLHIRINFNYSPH